MTLEEQKVPKNHHNPPAAGHWWGKREKHEKDILGDTILFSSCQTQTPIFAKERLLHLLVTLQSQLTKINLLQM